MNSPLLRSPERAVRYTEYLRKREDFSPKRQEFLQRRVYGTYRRLMRKFDERKFGGRIIDLGSVDGCFVDVCNSKPKCDALSIGVKDDVDFEADYFLGSHKKGSFDVVCANSLIEHLHDPTNLLDNAFLALRPGGHFILVTPHWPYCAKTFFDAYTHVQPYTHRSLRAALECHGFEVLAMVPWMCGKPDWWWDIPAPWSFRLASWLPFEGLDERLWVPPFLKGKSNSLLALGRKPIQ